MSLTVVSTFSEINWHDYANRSIPTWMNSFGKDVKFHFHCNFKPILDDRITYFSDSVRKNQFLERNYGANRKHKSKGYHGKWDRYCHKVFAQCESAFLTDTSFLLFLDADVACVNPVSTDTVTSLLSESFCGHVWREELGTETGFILYDLTKDLDKIFFKEFINCYESDEIFNLKHWDDCFVFDHCRLKTNNLSFINLSGEYSSFIDPISVGPLGEYFDHWMSKSGKSRGTSKYRHLRGQI